TSPAVARMIARHGWVEDARGDVYVLPAYLAALRERGLERGRLGTVGSRWIIPAGLHAGLVGALPSAAVEPAGGAVDPCALAHGQGPPGGGAERRPLGARQGRDGALLGGPPAGRPAAPVGRRGVPPRARRRCAGHPRADR